MDSRRAMRWNLYLSGALLIIMGVLCMIYPVSSLLSLTIFLGVGFLIQGVDHIYIYFKTKDDPMRPSWLIWQGALDLILGVLFLMNIGISTTVVIMMVNVWIIATGIFRSVTSFTLKSAGVENWWIMLLSGLVLLACGIALAFNPLWAALTVTYLLATTFIFAGIAAITEGNAIYKGSVDVIEERRRRREERERSEAAEDLRNAPTRSTIGSDAPINSRTPVGSSAPINPRPVNSTVQNPAIQAKQNTDNAPKA